ncbi:efflux RND transporter periplasmic adaptor subunit [Seohaeicola saemankumensis]|uniref:Efflux RND transporter periplasmic adaptor subunit n=1 Tax=Seohaeicola saemankumensis TaxID=481181 RepID=A0ABW3TGV5_9RHOB
MGKLVTLLLGFVILVVSGYVVVGPPAGLGEGTRDWAKSWLVSEQSEAGQSGIQFISERVERGSIRQVVTATGTLQALVTVQVGTQLSGQIAELFADFNDEVSKNQPLAQLDTKSYEARLAEAVAATAMAQANVDIQRARLERAQVDEQNAKSQRHVLQARVDNARARADAAHKALQRVRTLLDRGSGSTQQQEEATSAWEQASASLREAEAIAAAHEHLVAGAMIDIQRAEAELDNALTSVPQRQAVQKSVEIDLARTTIRSPVDGVIVGRNINEGQTVAASLEAPTLFTIAGNLQNMEIHARIDEADIGKIVVGQRASFSVDAHPAQHFEATVTGLRKAPQVIQNVVTYTVVLATENQRALLLPGMTATVRITVQEIEDVLKLPMAGLRFTPPAELARQLSKTALEAGDYTDGGPTLVWVLGDRGALLPAAVELGENDGAYAAVLGGALSEGDEVIVGEVPVSKPRELFGIRFGF